MSRGMRCSCAAVVAVLVGVGCSATNSEVDSDAGQLAGERAVVLTTTACGDSSRTTGSGVVVDQAIVLTAAHVVAGATDVFVDGAEEPAAVVLIDLTRDLALLKVPGVDAPPIELVDLDSGVEVQVVGGASSGTVDAVVRRRVRMEVDDVRSTTRSHRSGYELDAEIAGGDSGAGVFDTDGGLGGIVFAIPTERSGSTYAVGRSEIDHVLSVAGRGEYHCDPAQSLLVSSDG